MFGKFLDDFKKRAQQQQLPRQPFKAKRNRPNPEDILDDEDLTDEYTPRELPESLVPVENQALVTEALQPVNYIQPDLPPMSGSVQPNHHLGGAIQGPYNSLDNIAANKWRYKRRRRRGYKKKYYSAASRAKYWKSRWAIRNEMGRVAGRGGYNTRRYAGRGGFWSSIKKAAGMAGSLIPAGTFANLGGQYAGPLGAAAGSALSGITGMGAYNTGNVVKNSVVGKISEGDPIPTFDSKSKSVICTNVEFIANITVGSSPAEFDLSSFPINPGVPATFPQLALQARHYDSYEILGMVFHYRSMCSDEQVAQGQIMLAVDYNADDADPRDALHMLNTNYATSGKPSVNVVQAIECDPSVNTNTHMNVRIGALKPNEDIRLYDHGTLHVALEGLSPTLAAGTILGQLHVTYQVALYKPHIGAVTLADHFDLTPNVANVTAANPFGVLGATLADKDGPSEGSTLGCRVNGVGMIEFPDTINRGNYLISVNYQVSGSAWSTFPIAARVNNASLDLFENYSTDVSQFASVPSKADWGITITGPGATLSFAPTGLATGITHLDVTILQLPDNIVPV